MRCEKKRFWEKVRVGGSRSCWDWKGHKHHKGHGQFYFRGRAHYAHRISWILTFGEILNGLCVLHHCDNPKCVNPFHLFLGTQQDNILDMISKGRDRRGIFPGTKSPNAKLTEAKVKRIREFFEVEAATVRELSKMFNVSETLIRRIVKREAWVHV